MTIAHLDEDDMAYFLDDARRDPRALAADRQVRAYAEERGGLTLAYWRLALGRIWGEPYMMTIDEVAKRLKRPVSELQVVVDETHAALGWDDAAAGPPAPPREA